MRADIHTLVGAYLLDAIDGEEREEFEAHLAECVACREEIALLRRTVARIAEPVPPPPALRARVMAEAERTPQLPPLLTRRVPERRRRWAPRALAAAAAVVALAGGGVAVWETARDDRPPAVTASDVFAAPDARTETVALDGGQVRVAVSQELGRVAVDGSDMPAPPAGRVYQLWLVRDGQAESLSVMQGDRTSAVDSIPDEGVLAVTVEPTGGSTQPTGDPILTLDPAEI